MDSRGSPGAGVGKELAIFLVKVTIKSTSRRFPLFKAPVYHSPMLRRKQEINQQLQQVVDAFLLLIAFWASYALRSYGSQYGLDALPPFNKFTWMIVIIIPFGPLLLELRGFYEHPLQKQTGRTLGQLGWALVALSLLLTACATFLRLDVPSRSVLILFVLMGCGLLLLKDRLLLARARRLAALGLLREPVLLAGQAEDMERLLQSLTNEQLVHMEIIDRIDIEKSPLADLTDALHRHAISRVLFAASHSHLHHVQAAISACEVEGVEAWLVADFIKTSIARPSFESIGEQPMLVFRSTPDASWALLGKRVIDFTAALCGLVLLSWLFVAVALLIKLTSPGPVLFRQLRGGRHGKPFMMLKFRSMSTDAEMRRAEFAAFNQMSGPVFKIEGDPRVTRIGRWLRKTSIDELPQLVNVLRGEMSLVGPRPLPLYEVDKFETLAQRRRLSVSPGLTCLWQISGRNDIKDFQDWVKLDLLYIDNWSLWLDIKILCKTIPVVLLGLGAK
jgi:exopolysaccharide biosynthesis polyprenyl glycosylphosphotransferase